MHRGSSKGGARPRTPSEILPLSASPAKVRISVEVARAGAVRRRSVAVVPGSLVRDALRAVGQAPEGCAVTIDGVSVPLDLPVEPGVRLVVVPTFSGG
jgi:sulfur carrier protein ThiS